MKILKKLILIVLIIICIASISYATYLLSANQVSYTKDGNTMQLDVALNDLYDLAQNGSNKRYVTVAKDGRFFSMGSFCYSVISLLLMIVKILKLFVAQTDLILQARMIYLPVLSC